jgi:hypothetical protein
MKQERPFVTLSFPLFVAIGASSVAGLTNLRNKLAAVDSGASVDEQVFLTRPPTLFLPETEWDSSAELDWDAIDRTVSRIRSNLLNEINENFQGSIEQEFQKFLQSPGGDPAESAPPLWRE